MKTKAIIAILSSFLTLQSWAQADFTDLVKLTSSVFSLSADIDASNPSEISFETLLPSQRVFFYVQARKLNSSVFTLINSDPDTEKKHRKMIDPPVVTIHNMLIKIDDSEAPTVTCDGSDVIGEGTSCEGKKCKVFQRVISACNETNCWSADSSIDRTFEDGLSESFNLKEKIEITDCIPNNMAGYKHTAEVSVTNPSSPGVLAGGTISSALILSNDVIADTKRGN